MLWSDGSAPAGEFPEGAPSGPVELPAAEMGSLPALAKVGLPQHPSMQLPDEQLIQGWHSKLPQVATQATGQRHISLARAFAGAV